MKHIKLFEQYTKDGKFYLAIDDYAKLFDNELFLRDGLIRGLKGISSTKDIVNQLKSVCDIFVEMNEKDVLGMNHLVKIEYDNAELLVKDNFKLLKRVMGNDLSRSKNQYFLELIFSNSIHLGFIDKIDSDLCFFLRTSIRMMLKKETPNINSVNNICNWILTEYKYDFNELHKIISDYIVYLVHDYVEEEEWFVTSEYFIIPPQSNIYLDMECIKDNVEEENFDQAKEDITNKVEKFLSNYNIIYGTFAETEV